MHPCRALIHEQVTEQSLHGSIGAAPSVIIAPILRVMIVEVISSHCVAQSNRVSAKGLVDVQRSVDYRQQTHVLLLVGGHPKS